MPKYQKIKRSKFLSYRKQGFLYLVFILFLFFSQAGDFVIHYLPLAKTQEVYNDMLEENLRNAELANAEEVAYRDAVLERVQQLDSLQGSFDNYISSSVLSASLWRDNRYSERFLRSGRMGRTFESLWLEQGRQGPSIRTPEFIRGYTNESLSPGEFFFKETPNAALPSIYAHAKMAMLLDATEKLDPEVLAFTAYAVKSLEGTAFTSLFKKQLVLGENFDISFMQGSAQDSITRVLVGGLEVPLKREAEITSASYTPRKVGNYFVEVSTASNRYYTSFEVIRPRLELQSAADLVAFQLGKVQPIELNTSLLPPGQFQFVSEHAELNYRSGNLYIKPLIVGEFIVKLVVNGETTDQVVLRSSKPDQLKVTLANTRGQACEPLEAHRIQSVNPNFQVLSYEAVFYADFGPEPLKFNEISRLLPTKLQDALATQNGTLVIQNIVLLSSDGVTKVEAQPYIVRSHG